MKALRSQNFNKSANAITQNLVYSFPTISKLASYLEELVGGAMVNTADTRALEVETLIAKYTWSGIAGRETFTPNSSESNVVLLTGSTGNLGSQILASLLKDDRVVKIYAFNRPSNRSLVDRHADTFIKRGLDTALLSSPKLVFVEGQSTKENLGLPLDRYEEVRSSDGHNFPVVLTPAHHKIRNSITHIIHNAWTLDFNTLLSSFEPHIRATHHLIDLAHSSPRTPRFMFASSIASAQGWDNSRPCPEDVLNDPSVAVGGYGQSKYVAEQVRLPSALFAFFSKANLADLGQERAGCHMFQNRPDMWCPSEGCVGDQRLVPDIGQDKHNTRPAAIG
jgi:hypothetical protein